MGNIGSALARTAILRKQFDVFVWNRTIEKAEKLFTKEEIEEDDITNFSVCEDLKNGIQQCDIIVISLYDYQSAYNALDQQQDNLSSLSEAVKALEGKHVIHLTSSIPAESRNWAQLMDTAKAINLDGCVIGWPSMVGSESFSILISGCEEKTFKEIKELLRVWGKPVYVGPHAGQGDALDIAILTYLQGIKFGFMQGLALCEQAGVSREMYTDFAKHYLSVYSSVLDDTAKKVESRNYTEQVNTTVSILHKFNRNVLQHAKETGQSTELLHAIDAPLSALMDNGKQQMDQTACFEYMLDCKSKFFDNEKH